MKQCPATKTYRRPLWLHRRKWQRCSREWRVLANGVERGPRPKTLARATGIGLAGVARPEWPSSPLVALSKITMLLDTKSNPKCGKRGRGTPRIGRRGRRGLLLQRYLTAKVAKSAKVNLGHESHCASAACATGLSPGVHKPASRFSAVAPAQKCLSLRSLRSPRSKK